MTRKVFPCAEISLVDRRQVMSENFQLTLNKIYLTSENFTGCKQDNMHFSVHVNKINLFCYVFSLTKITFPHTKQVLRSCLHQSRTFQKVSGFLHSDTVIIHEPMVHKTVVWLNPGLTCKIHWKFSRSLLNYTWSHV